MLRFLGSSSSGLLRRSLSGTASKPAPSATAKSFAIKGQARQGRSIYLDFQATSPLDPRVLDAMLPFWTTHHGNPHSSTHHYGWEAEEATEKARGHVASLLGADPKEVFFTSGATESNNAIIKGVARFYGGKKKHIITVQTEHKCVLEACRQLQQEGFEVTYLPVQQNGLVSLADVEAAIRPGETSLLSCMFVNNEIGVVQPLKEIGELCKRNKVFFHTDAAQGFGKLPFDVNEIGADLVSVTAHKLYGPKGIGAMYVRRKPRVRIEPLIAGGGQERGLRSGTVATPLAVGFGEACRVAANEMDADLAHVNRLSERLYESITSRLDEVVVNGDLKKRYAGNLNLSFAYVEGESLLMALKEVAVSSGSACTSASLEPSYVLKALGVEEDMAHTSIRFGLGRFTTQEEIDYAADLTVRHVERLREMSPLYDMVKAGIDLKTINWSH